MLSYSYELVLYVLKKGQVKSNQGKTDMYEDTDGSEES